MIPERGGKLERDELVAAVVLGLIGVAAIAAQGFVATRSQRWGSDPDIGLAWRARWGRLRDRLFPREPGEPFVTDEMMAEVHREARSILESDDDA